jgi:hypothetical protein
MSYNPKRVEALALLHDGLITAADGVNKLLELEEPKEHKQSGVSAVDQVQNNFPKDLAELLTFEIKDDCAIIKPKQFLGTGNFAKIAAIVRNLSGEYVSAGKESHFRIPKKS